MSAETKWGGSPILRQLEKEISIKTLLEREAQFLQWKRKRYLLLLKAVEKEVGEQQKLVNEYKQRQLSTESYRAEADALGMSTKLLVKLQSIQKSLEQRLDKILSPSSATIQNKKDDLNDLVNDVESLRGRQRQEFRHHIYNLLRKFHANSLAFVNSLQMNMIIMGKAGTGKTTAAQVYGRSLARIGLMATSQFFEKSRTDFIGEYAGQTQPRTLAVLRQGLEGVIFLDEAYGLATSNEGGGASSLQGKEALETMLGFMTTHVGLSCIVLAGYEKPMIKLMGVNEGIIRRFPERFVLEDYTESDLLEILENHLAKRSQELIKMFGPQGKQIIMDWIHTENEVGLFTNQAGDMQTLADKLLDASLAHKTPQDALVEFKKSKEWETKISSSDKFCYPPPATYDSRSEEFAEQLVKAILNKSKFDCPLFRVEFVGDDRFVWEIPQSMKRAVHILMRGTSYIMMQPRVFSRERTTKEDEIEDYLPGASSKQKGHSQTESERQKKEVGLLPFVELPSYAVDESKTWMERDELKCVTETGQISESGITWVAEFENCFSQPWRKLGFSPTTNIHISSSKKDWSIEEKKTAWQRVYLELIQSEWGRLLLSYPPIVQFLPPSQAGEYFGQYADMNQHMKESREKQQRSWWKKKPPKVEQKCEGGNMPNREGVFINIGHLAVKGETFIPFKACLNGPYLDITITLVSLRSSQLRYYWQQIFKMFMQHPTYAKLFLHAPRVELLLVEPTPHTSIFS
jgi:hypothetical protein